MVKLTKKGNWPIGKIGEIGNAEKRESLGEFEECEKTGALGNTRTKRDKLENGTKG